jgi:uncharacterized protein
MDARPGSSPKRVGLTGAIAFVVWLVLAAPAIERSVSGAELGPWRDLRLAVVRPFADARDSAVASRPASPMVVVEPSAYPPVSVAGAEATPAPTSKPAVTPIPARVPTVGDPLRVLVIGDSMAGDLGRSLGRLTAAGGLVAIDLDYRAASGLSRPDYFDWPAQLAADLRRVDPDVVVVELGANDAQSFALDGHLVGQDTDEWRAVYAARVASLLGLATMGGRRAVWVGLPVMADPSFGELMRRENVIASQRSEAISRVIYLDTWTLFAGPDGSFAAYLPDASGRPAPMRQPDGIHLSVAGAERLANAVAGVLADEFPALR